MQNLNDLQNLKDDTFQRNVIDQNTRIFITNYMNT